MLDDYKISQKNMYNLMMNEIKNNHLSHAYLIDENDNSDSINIVMAFIKEILCMNLNDDARQLLCKRIDDGNYLELKIIEPDGMLIKKQQILELQREFSMSSVEGNKRIYIIRDADKMRNETANSMLKFLEEPQNNIIAILMTNNFNNLLPTIISRCQIIKLNKNDEPVFNEKIDLITLEFIETIEKDGKYSIVNEQKLLFDKLSLKERDKYINFFDKMIDMYYDILQIIISDCTIKYVDYVDRLKAIAFNNTYESILSKINILIDTKDKIKYNVNMNLLIDKLIIDFGGVYEASWS